MRTADEIFEHHLEVFGAGDIDGILTDYSEDSVMMYGEEIWYGLSGARDFFHLWIDDLIPAGSRFDVIERIATNDMLYITWNAESYGYIFDYGSDTFVMKDDKIWRQTVATFHRAKS